MSNNDSNRINLSQCEGIKNIDLSNHPLFQFIKSEDVPLYSTTELKNVTVDPTSPRNSEPLVNVNDYNIKSCPYYKEEAINNPTYNSNISGAPDIIYAREGVCKQLQKINKLLSTLGLELVINDAHRSPATQKKLFMHFLRIAYQKGLKGEEAIKNASQYCSNPEGFDTQNPQTWTMHSTGAAVDVYLVDKKTDKIVDMGEGYYDNPDPVTHTLHYEELAKKRKLSDEEKDALMARRLLFNVMKAMGFDNYGFEIFHYEYKCLIHAKVQSEKGIPAVAEYGYLPSPADVQKGMIISSLLAHKTREQ